MSHWIPPNEDWVEAQVQFAMIGYTPPVVTDEMLAIYSEHDVLNSDFVNPHYIRFHQLTKPKE